MFGLAMEEKAKLEFTITANWVSTRHHHREEAIEVLRWTVAYRSAERDTSIIRIRQRKQSLLN
jgi:hypothetical protein